MVGENQDSVVSWQTKRKCFKKERVVNHITVTMCAAERSWKYELNIFCFSNKEVTDDSESSVCEGEMGQLWKSTVSWQVNGSSGFRESYYGQYFYEVWLGMGGKRIGRSWRGIWDPGKVFLIVISLLLTLFIVKDVKNTEKQKR